MVKSLILFFMVLTYSTSSWAQDVGSAENNTNQILLNNAANSQNPNAQPTHIGIFNDTSNTTSSANLTDQQKQLSENYVHLGKSNRIIQEKCVGDMKQACAGFEPDHKVMGMNPGLIKAATMAYATMGAMGGDDLLGLTKPAATKAGDVVKDKAAETTKEKAGDAAKDEKANDYCKYIPVATEMIAKFSQQNAITAMSTGETSQKEALLKAAKSHDNRAEQAKIQSFGWYGGAACYILSQFNPTPALFVKAGAAGFLGMFYDEEKSANEGYADKTRAIANAIPSAGQCNPITENECYCSEPSTQNDPQYCKVQIAARAAQNANQVRTACTNDKLQVDPSCACEKTNSCFEKFMENQGATNLQIGTGYANSPFKPLASLAHGTLESGVLNGSAAAKLSAIAKKGLNEFSSKIKDNSFLTPAQKTIADAIASKGFPSELARLMATHSPSQAAMDKSKGKFDGFGAAPNIASYSPSSGKSNIVDFSGGNGLGLSGKKAEKKDGMSDILSKLNPKAKAANNSNLLQFAEKAQAQAAQITKSDRPIFEIISLRYQTSGRRLLQIDASN